MKIKKIHSKKKIITLVLAGLVVVSGVYIAVASATSTFPFGQSTKKSLEINDQEGNLERSDSEKAAIDKIADDPSLKSKNDQTDKPQTPTEQNDEDKVKVNLLLTNVGIANGTVSASGFVTDLVEEGGECEYRFVSGSNVVTKASRTLTNSTSTTCETIRFSADELSASDDWDVEVSYESSYASGVSASKRLTK